MAKRPYADPILENLAQRFEFHGLNIYGSASSNSSPLYAALCSHIANDPDLLQLVNKADRAQQVSNLLFGAVHYLLLGGLQHSLTAFYASLTPTPLQPSDAYPAFRDFCLHYAGEIRVLVNSRRVQTNEVQRCTGLLPAFEIIAQRTQAPLACLEIGASAGLNLLWDTYFYDYGAAGQYGDPASPVQLHCEVKSGTLPALIPLETQYLLGLDLMPISVHDTDAIRWLRALIWAEQVQRADLFEKAIAHAAQHPVKVIEGDAAHDLADLLDAVPPDLTLCVYHSYTLNQMPEAVRQETLEILNHYALKRDFFRVSLEWYGNQPQPQLELFQYQNGQMSSELLAYCESHGRWIEWLYQEKS